MNENTLPAILDENAFAMLERRANTLSKSSIIPYGLRNKAADIVVILLMAHELDIPPMQAINGIHVIEGKPTISPQLMIALIRKKMPDAFIKITEGKLSCSCQMARSTSEKDMLQSFTSDWTIQRAQTMGLASKANYVKQPQTMLRWRAVGEAARQIFPDILSGLYFPEEFDELISGEDGKISTDIDGDNIKITSTDVKALNQLMREREWSPDQVKNICIEKFRVHSAVDLTKRQFKNLVEFLNKNPSDD